MKQTTNGGDLKDIKPPPRSNIANNSIIKSERGSDNSNVGENGSGSCNLMIKIDELERQLREEKESFAVFKSESELQKIGACQEVGLQENVGRLEEDCKTVYERCAALKEGETRDGERIQGLLSEIERKDGEFKQKIDVMSATHK